MPRVMGWLFKRLGNWQLPLVLGAGPGGSLVRRGLALASGNRPEQMPRVSAAERELIVSGRVPRRPRTPHLRALPGAMLRSTNVWALCAMYGFLGFSGNFFLFLFGQLSPAGQPPLRQGHGHAG